MQVVKDTKADFFGKDLESDQTVEFHGNAKLPKNYRGILGEGEVLWFITQMFLEWLMFHRHFLSHNFRKTVIVFFLGGDDSKQLFSLFLCWKWVNLMLPTVFLVAFFWFTSAWIFGQKHLAAGL